jgi:hypothetical protein
LAPLTSTPECLTGAEAGAHRRGWWALTPHRSAMGARRLRRQQLDDPRCRRLGGARGVGRTQWPLLWSTCSLLFPHWAIRAATTSTTGAGDNCSSNCSHLICESSTQSRTTVHSNVIQLLSLLSERQAPADAQESSLSY